MQGWDNRKKFQHFKFLVLFKFFVFSLQLTCPLLGSGLHYSTQEFRNQTINCRSIFIAFRITAKWSPTNNSTLEYSSHTINHSSVLQLVSANKKNSKTFSKIPLKVFMKLVHSLVIWFSRYEARGRGELLVPSLKVWSPRKGNTDIFNLGRNKLIASTGNGEGVVFSGIISWECTREFGGPLCLFICLKYPHFLVYTVG